MRTIEEAHLGGKRVLVRVDFNVPLENGRITNDYRLRQTIPTILYLINRQAKVILISHLGHPSHAEKDLSLEPIYNHLSKLLHIDVEFFPGVVGQEVEQAVDNLESGQILGLENLRFDKGESNNSRTFARKLSQLGDIYVNDAFSVSHRESASISAITEFLPSYAGLLFETEHNMLKSLLKHPAKPFVAVIGGAKISDKLPVISQLSNIADRILIGGAVANTFLAVNGVNVKDSLIDKDYFEQAKHILQRSKGKIVLPTDLVWEKDKIMDLGTQTTLKYLQYLRQSKTILWNGCLGLTEKAQYAKSSEAIAKSIAQSGATTIVGGGNTIGVIDKLHLLSNYSFVSTAGGAMLEFLAGKPLPGIIALEDSH